MEDTEEPLNPAAFPARVAARAERALTAGALMPLLAREEIVEDGGIPFVLRVAERPARKPVADRAGGGRPRTNPFLPFDPALHVCDLSEDYAVLLNKYNLIDHHLLIITRAFEPQDSVLTPRDFQAAEWVLSATNGLGFYNNGALAGSSQPHKHLQVVPLPLGSRGQPRVPVEVRLAPGADPLPFAYRVARFTTGFSHTEAHEHYLRMLGELGLEPETPGDTRPGPHNLLFTREWMMMVPRSREDFDGIPVNALGYAGSLFVRDLRAFSRLRRHGPLQVLRCLGRPFSGS